MNRSSASAPINNSEIRKMSNPIPISVNNAWQMRSPQSFTNIDDSTQFDPGILPDQCISQSSISPSSAASYSLSPTQAIYNANNNMYLNQQHHHLNMVNSNNSHLQQQQQAFNNINNNNNIVTVNFDPYNTLDLVVSSNQQMQHNSNNLLNGAPFSTTHSVNNLSDTFASLDDSNSTSNIAIDLESLLVNTTLSDSSQNILLQQHQQQQHHSHTPDEDPNSEDNINITNNINPMFLFNNYKFNNTDLNNNNNINNNNNNNNNNNQSTTMSSSESNKIKNILQQQQKIKLASLHQESHSNNSSSNFNNNVSFNLNENLIRQRNKIVEEGEEDFDSSHNSQFTGQFNYTDQLQHGIQPLNQLGPMSLPTTSYLDSNSYRFINNPVHIHQNSNNQYNSYISDSSASPSSFMAKQQSPLADPVLTQIQLNSHQSIENPTKNAKAQLILNNQHLISISNQPKQSRKVNFLIQDNQTKQQQYFNPNSFLNTNAINMPSLTTTNANFLQQQQNNMVSSSISLPVYSNIFDYISNNNKPIEEKKNNEMLNASKNSDEIRFSKLKISSPASSTSSASSSSSSAQQYLNIKTEASLMDDAITAAQGNLLFETDDTNDVISVFSRNEDNNNSNFDHQQLQQTRQTNDDHNDSLFHDLNQIVVLNFNNNNNSNSNINDEQSNAIGSKMDQLDVNNQQSWNPITNDLNTIQVDSARLDDSLGLDLENKDRQKEKIQMYKTANQEQQYNMKNEILRDFDDEAESIGDEEDEEDYDEDDDDDDDEDDEDDEEDEEDEDDDDDYENDETSQINNNNDDSNFAIQFCDDLVNSNILNKRRSNRIQKSSTISSSSLTKVIKVSSQQLIKRRSQPIGNVPQAIMFANSQQQSAKQQQLFVGSVGSNMTMMRRSSNNASRKHARTTVNSSGVDVHTSQQQQPQTVQQLNSTNSKNLFSNLQFSPFNNPNYSSTPTATLSQQQPQQPIQSQQQQSQQSFLSTSLPSTHNFDSMMIFLNKPPAQPQHTNTLYGLVTQPNKNAQSQHPNLNKLLLNNTSIQQSTPKLPATVKPLSETNKKGQQVKAEPAKQQKKRQQKKQDLYEDDDDDEDLDSESDEDLASDEDNLKKNIKMEESDYDSDSTELNMSNNKSKSSKVTSASSSYANHESLFDLMMSSKNRDAYFWQYNIQSKGPKTKKVLTLRNKDPHLHRDFFDPVFQLQSLNRVNGGVAVNKLRKGDGNDVTPNVEKLYNLGNQIRDFIQKSYQMNSACFSPPPQHSSISSSLNQLGTTPTSSNLLLSSSVDTAFISNQQQPIKERVNLKREKNKIASRACRLKKKAQHEANKIKLSGLNEEHKQLIDCINSARDLIKTRLTNPEKLPIDKKMIDLIDEQIRKKLKTKVAGNSDGYVHSLMLVLEKEKSKNNKGGLFDLSNQPSFAQSLPQQTIKIEQVQHNYGTDTI